MRIVDRLFIAGSLLLAQCSPMDAQSTLESPCLPPASFSPERINQGFIEVGPNESCEIQSITFYNDMSDYSMRFNANILSDLATHYGITLQSEKPTTIILTPTIITGGITDGVVVQILDSGEEYITISGGLFVELVIDKTGHEPNNLQDQTFLSMAFSDKLIGGFAQLAEKRGDIGSGEARKIEAQYAEDFINLDQLLVGGMQILPQATPIPELIG